jgi:hypothetical protein
MLEATKELIKQFQNKKQTIQTTGKYVQFIEIFVAHPIVMHY